MRAVECYRQLSRITLYFTVSEAIDKMIIDQPGRLHMGVDDGGPDKGKSSALEVFTYRPGQVGLRRNLRELPEGVYKRSPVEKSPDVPVKGTELFLHGEKGAGVPDGGTDLFVIANDSGVTFQTDNVFFSKPRNGVWVKSGKTTPVPFPTFQDRKPAQPRLGAFQDEKLKMAAFIMDGDAPFRVVIDNVVRIITAPWTSRDTFRRFHRRQDITISLSAVPAAPLQPPSNARRRSLL